MKKSDKDDFRYETQATTSHDFFFLHYYDP